MTSGVTWEVEDIPQHAREAALDAARRSGMSIGEWLDSVISDHAGNEGPRTPDRDDATSRRRSPTEDIAEVKGRLAEVGRQLDQLSRLNAQPYLRANLRPEEHPRELADVLWKLDRRLEQLIGAGRLANGASDMVERAAGAMDPQRSVAVDANPSNPLAQALLEIAERQRALDAGGGPSAAPSTRRDILPRAPTQGLSNLEEQLRQVTTRFETLQPCGANEALETLRDDLAEIGLMVKEAAPRQAIEALELEVRGLSDRLHASSQTQGSDTAIASVERGLSEIHDALRALSPAENLVGVDQAVQDLSRKIDLIASHPQDPATMAQLEDAIVGLRGVASHVASDGALAKLSDEVRDLAAKVDRIAGSAELLTTLEQRLSSLTAALESRPEVGTATPNDLDAAIKGLTERIGQLGPGSIDQAQASHLGDRINTLVEKLDSSNARLDHLEPVERALTDLLVFLERQAATEPLAAAPPADVSSLRQDVRDTQNSLESMQGALEHLIDRLAGIENDIRSGRAAPPPAAALQTGAEPSIDRPAVVTVLGDVPAVPAKPGPAATAASASIPAAQNPAVSPEHQPIDPTLPPDHPLEPGALRGRGGNSPVERIAASEAALGSVKPPAAPDSGSKASFIAAARRAAQAANGEGGARAEKLAPSVTAPPTPTTGATGGWGSRVRSVLVAASVVVIVLSSLHLVASFFQSSDERSDGAAPQQVQPQVKPDETQPQQIQSAPKGDEPSGIPQAPGRPDDTVAPGSKIPSAPVPGRQSLSAPADGEPSLAIVQTAQPLPFAPMPDVMSFVGGAKDVTRSIGPAVPPPEPAGTGSASVDKLPPAIGGLLRAAAAKGDPSAEYEIAQRFAEGRGVPQNLAEAAGWFDLAAQQGLAPAQFRLGGFYEKGFGVKKDLDTARKLYSAAADAGNAKAMHNLAVLYAEGIDGKPDYQNAAKWFRRAADYGLTDSQYNLGILYGRGIGMSTNLTDAYKWFALAARDGDKESSAKRDEVAGRLDPQSLAAAKAAAQAWSPMQQPEAATQAMVPPGGWDIANVLPPTGPKPHRPAPQSDYPQAAPSR